MKVFKRTISSIVDENYIYARALSCLGIEFYLNPNKLLGEICKEKGLNHEKVVKSFYAFDQINRVSLKALEKYPLEILMQYLRHSHHLFIKDRLPYIAKLLKAYGHEHDLKTIFPDFIEEFIEHIHQEEDELFGKVEDLLKIDQHKTNNPAVLWLKHDDLSVFRAHQEHEEEDELNGLRELIEENKPTGIHWRVIISELRAFDREMLYHAQIENKIFFPKAIQLEAKVKENMTLLIRQN
jgi:regulator of cell morphogenesis and NO signaling